jgi:hypothetical protein
LLIFEPEKTPPKELLPIDRVENLWASWTEGEVTPLSATTEIPPSQGVQVEKLDEVAGLRNLVYN